MENQKQSDYYLNKLTSHTTFLILFAVLTVIMYFIFMRNEKISFDFFSTLLAFSILGYHIYGIISNFKKFNSLSKLENEQYILDQTQSDKQES